MDKQVEFHLRPVEHDDLEDLLRLVSATFAYYGVQDDPDTPAPARMLAALRKYLNQSPGFEATIARDAGGKAVGYTIQAPLFWTSDCTVALFLKEIFVVSSARHKGLGQTLMQAVAQTCRERDYSRLVWTVDRRNHEAIAFYQSFHGPKEHHKDLYSVGGERLKHFSRKSKPPAPFLFRRTAPRKRNP